MGRDYNGVAWRCCGNPVPQQKRAEPIPIRYIRKNSSSLQARLSPPTAVSHANGVVKLSHQCSAPRTFSQAYQLLCVAGSVGEDKSKNRNLGQRDFRVGTRLFSNHEIPLASDRAVAAERGRSLDSERSFPNPSNALFVCSPVSVRKTMTDTKKKSRKERQRELRMLEKDISGGKSVIDYGKVNEVGRQSYAPFFPLRSSLSVSLPLAGLADDEIWSVCVFFRLGREEERRLKKNRAIFLYRPAYNMHPRLCVLPAYTRLQGVPPFLLLLEN